MVGFAARGAFAPMGGVRAPMDGLPKMVCYIIAAHFWIGVTPHSNSRYAAALARRLSLALRGLALRPWSILSERRERALSDRATPSCRCYRHSVNAPVAAQIPCFATMSAADLALRGPLAPTRPYCPARVCACSSDPTWVASLYAYSLHRAVATVNMDAAAVNIMMALVLPSRRPGFGSGHQTQR